VVFLGARPGVLFRQATRARADSRPGGSGRRGSSSAAPEGRADHRSPSNRGRGSTRTAGSGCCSAGSGGAGSGSATATIIGSGAAARAASTTGVQINTVKAVLSPKSAS
jgi:hypothetical protein